MHTHMHTDMHTHTRTHTHTHTHVHTHTHTHTQTQTCTQRLFQDKYCHNHSYCRYSMRTCDLQGSENPTFSIWPPSGYRLRMLSICLVRGGACTPKSVESSSNVFAIEEVNFQNSYYRHIKTTHGRTSHASIEPSDASLQ